MNFNKRIFYEESNSYDRSSIKEFDLGLRLLGLDQLLK